MELALEDVVIPAANQAISLYVTPLCSITGVAKSFHSVHVPTPVCSLALALVVVLPCHEVAMEEHPEAALQVDLVPQHVTNAVVPTTMHAIVKLRP